MKKHIENSGKKMGSVEHHSVPTSLKRAKTFLQDEYLKDIEANDDEHYFYFNASAITAIRNTMLLILFRLPFALYLDK